MHRGRDLHILVPASDVIAPNQTVNKSVQCLSRVELG